MESLQDLAKVRKGTQDSKAKSTEKTGRAADITKFVPNKDSFEITLVPKRDAEGKLVVTESKTGKTDMLACRSKTIDVDGVKWFVQAMVGLKK